MGHIFGEQLEFPGTPVGGNQRKCGFRRRSDADHGDLLHVGAVVAGGLQAVQGELRGNVLRRNIAAALPGAAPFEQVVGQEAHMSADVLSIDFLKCSNRGRWKMNRHGMGCVLRQHPADQENQRQRHQLLAHASRLQVGLRELCIVREGKAGRELAFGSSGVGGRA